MTEDVYGAVLQVFFVVIDGFADFVLGKMGFEFDVNLAFVRSVPKVFDLDVLIIKGM